MKNLTKIFKTISTKYQNVAVKSFSTSLEVYYFQRKQKFLELYQQKLELLEFDQRTQHEENKAGATVITQGVKNGKRRIKNVRQKETTTERFKQRDSSATSKASVAMPFGTTPIQSKLTINLPAKSLKSASSLESKTCSSALPSSRPTHSQVALTTSIAASSPVSFTSVPPVSIHQDDHHYQILLRYQPNHI